jgi:hypothetical protein
VGGGCEGCDVALWGEPSTTVTKDRARLVVERVRDLVAPPTYQECRGRSQGRLVELGSLDQRDRRLENVRVMRHRQCVAEQLRAPRRSDRDE